MLSDFVAFGTSLSCNSISCSLFCSLFIEFEETAVSDFAFFSFCLFLGWLEFTSFGLGTAVEFSVFVFDLLRTFSVIMQRIFCFPSIAEGFVLFRLFFILMVSGAA